VTEGIAAEFLKNGFLGTTVLALALSFWRVYKELRRVQDCRVQEANSVVDRIAKLVSACNDATAAQTAMVERYNAALEKMRAECEIRTGYVANDVKAINADMKELVGLTNQVLAKVDR